MNHISSLTLTAYPDGTITATHHGPNFTRAERSTIPPGRGAASKVRLAASRIVAEAAEARRGWKARTEEAALKKAERRKTKESIKTDDAAAQGAECAGTKAVAGNGAVVLILEEDNKLLEFEDLVSARRWLKDNGNPRVRSCRLKSGGGELIYQPACRAPADKYGGL